MKKVCLFMLAGLLAASTVIVHAATFAENFAANPLQDGWQISGNTNLFQWNSTNRNLNVTWDSSQSNSYFYHPLGTILSASDNFSLEFDLQLTDATVSGSFEVAVGLLNMCDATNAGFSRAQVNNPNLCEFDYFPDGGYGPSLDATLVDTNNIFYFAYNDTLPLNVGVSYHIVLTHVAGQPGVTGEVLTNGQIYAALSTIYDEGVGNFRIGSVSITSYTSTDDPYGDTLLAHGTVGNILVTLPPPPVQNCTGTLSNGVWQAQFCSGSSNWLYTLQRTTDFRSWTNAGPATPGNATNLCLPDLAPPLDKAFYRVNATLP